METSFCLNKACAQCWALIGFRGCKGLQPSRSRSFSGRMASAFAKASPFAKGFGGQVGGHVRAVPISISPNLEGVRSLGRLLSAGGDARATILGRVTSSVRLQKNGLGNWPHSRRASQATPLLFGHFPMTAARSLVFGHS